MTLRVSHLVATLVLLSLGNSQIGVNAAACTAEQQAYIDKNYVSITQGAATACSKGTCDFGCQDQLESYLALVADCTASDGNNYHEALAVDYACSESESSESSTASATNTCSEDNEILTGNIIAKASLGDCGANDPCEPSCKTKLTQLVNELPDCALTDGNNYYQYYLSLVSSCTSTTSETTPAPSDAPTETTSAPATTTAAPTATTATPTASTSAPTTGNSTSSEATEEEEETTEATSASAEAEPSASAASAAASASASKDNGATSVGGGAIGSLVVAGTLALLAAQA